MSRRVNHLIAFITVCCLWLPLGARALGHRAAVVENRNLLPAPRVDAGWDFFKELGPYLNDHLPLRQRAITTDAWIDVHVFKEDPSFGGNGTPRVLTGSNGFLYINDAFSAACSPHLPPTESADHFARLASIIQSSGRRVVTAVAPDKSSVLPQYLPKDFLLRKCHRDNTNLLWDSLRDANIPGFVELRTALGEASRRTRQPLFFRKDTHWDPAGSLVAAKLLIEKLQPGLWDDSLISDNGLFVYEGDLTGLRGLPEKDEAPSFSVNRPGVSVVSVEQAPGFDQKSDVRTIRTVPSGNMIKGRTLALIDSFGYAALPHLAPYFEDLTTVSLNDYEPQKFLRLINDADTVLIMSVERSLAWRMAKESGSNKFLALLSSSLVGR